MTLYTVMFLLACRSEKVQEDTAEQPDWWETEDGGSSEASPSDVDNEDTAEKPEELEEEKDSGFEEVEECAENFDPDMPCQGDWTTTLCMYDGQLWWCEGGVWMNEEEK